ncbi:MAG: DNA repair protein RecN [Bacteroidaceae bacterium]|nr:DNA repair protein RecN [Bacteroidaceae bacterium]
MLQHLNIQNYALIDQLDIDFGPGFSVITGETGAGKSILLGAIGLLLGQRADSRSIKAGAQRCVIEAQFRLTGHDVSDFFTENELDFDGEECIIRRELTATGKSRSFINDTPATLAQLKELGDKIIDIHSQHQNLLLSKENFQLQVVDILANSDMERLAYKKLYCEMQQTQQTLEETRRLALAGKEEQEFLQYQFDQLAEANLRADEQEELETEQQTLEHAEDIHSGLLSANAQLEGDDTTAALDLLRQATRHLSHITEVFPQAEPLVERLESCHIELKDIASELVSLADDIESDPRRLEQVNDRLSLIYELQHKHHLESVEELIALQHDLEEKLCAITNSDEAILNLEKQLQQQQTELNKLADALTAKRKKAGKIIEKEMCERLIPLGMPKVQFEVQFQPIAFSPSGCDRVSFFFSANKNGQLSPISQVASGGEMARVMLSLKALISGAVQLPTIIFDEIDMGVSGHIAECMAHIMKEMGNNQERQVFSITHLPQIAALGHTHYRVFKEDDEQGTTSHIVQLTDDERVEEIAHMLSGATLTQAAIENAKALLNK